MKLASTLIYSQTVPALNMAVLLGPLSSTNVAASGMGTDTSLGSMLEVRKALNSKCLLSALLSMVCPLLITEMLKTMRLSLTSVR